MSVLSKMKNYIAVKTPAYAALGRYRSQTGTTLLFLPFAWGAALSISPFSCLLCKLISSEVVSDFLVRVLQCPILWMCHE